MFFLKDRGGGVTIEYKGKKYVIQKVKEEQRVRPVGEENSKNHEIIVKDYEIGKWNVVVNVNGEIITVGWGPMKHLTIWGSIILVVVITIIIIQRRLKKRDKARWRRIEKEAKKHEKF